jgi:hypothetical protein
VVMKSTTIWDTILVKSPKLSVFADYLTILSLLHLYSETLICRSRMYRFPRSIVQFLWSLNKSYLNYGNKTRINRSSIYRFPTSIGQNF